MARLVVLVLCCTSLLSQSPPSFGIRANFIKVPVTVQDQNGRLLSDLKREDFLLLDENEPRTIENFVLDRAPLRVALLLDTSGSLEEELKQIRKAALRFAQSFGKEDLISVSSFSDGFELLQDWTSDSHKVRGALNRLEPGLRTTLYDALQRTVERLDRIAGRTVIILLTDGLDNQSKADFRDVLQDLIRSGSPLYIVSRTRLLRHQVQNSRRIDFLNRVMKNVLDDPEDFVEIFFREKESSMTQLAETTGGRVLFPKELDELESSYGRVASELKAQYLLTFLPPTTSDRQFRRITVETKRSVGEIFHRRQYHWTGLASSSLP